MNRVLKFHYAFQSASLTAKWLDNFSIFIRLHDTSDINIQPSHPYKKKRMKNRKKRGQKKEMKGRRKTEKKQKLYMKPSSYTAKPSIKELG